MPTLNAVDVPAAAMSVLPGATCRTRVPITVTMPDRAVLAAAIAAIAGGGLVAKANRAARAAASRAVSATRACQVRRSGTKPAAITPARPARPRIRRTGLIEVSLTPVTPVRNGVITVIAVNAPVTVMAVATTRVR